MTRPPKQAATRRRIDLAQEADVRALLRAANALDDCRALLRDEPALWDRAASLGLVLRQRAKLRAES